MHKLVDCEGGKLKESLKFILDGSEVSRYHTVRTLQTETVGHHSHGVAMFCCLLCTPSANLLRAALVHDLAEHVLGDIPSPAKKKYGIGEQVNDLEKELLKSVGMDVNISANEARTLKMADIFQGMTFCLREIQMGNEKMREIFFRYACYAGDLIPRGKESDMMTILMEQYHAC